MAAAVFFSLVAGFLLFAVGFLPSKVIHNYRLYNNQRTEKSA